jgi:hypothetical protein
MQKDPMLCLGRKERNACGVTEEKGVTDSSPMIVTWYFGSREFAQPTRASVGVSDFVVRPLVVIPGVNE